MEKEKRYRVHCYELDTNERTTCHWTEKQLALAEHLCRKGVVGIIENLGYLYRFDELKKALENLTEGERQYFLR